MSRASLQLEDFTPAPDAAAPPTADYHAGFAAGEEAARATIEAENAEMSRRFVDAVEDIGFTHAAARQHVLSALHPVLTATADRVLPELIREGFAAHLVSVLSEALEAAAPAQLTLAVPPQAETMAREALEPLATPPVLIRPDPSLKPGQALICADGTETLLDLPALLVALQQVLRGLSPDERLVSHG